MTPRSSAQLFAVLGDEFRLKLIGRMRDNGAMSITGLTRGSRISRQAVTKHLRLMEEARLARCERRGRESVWRLNEKRLADARHYLDLVSKQWDDALGRLRKLVEHPDRRGRNPVR